MNLGEAFGPVHDNDWFRIFTPEQFWPELEVGYMEDQLVAERVRQMEAGNR